MAQEGYVAPALVTSGSTFTGHLVPGGLSGVLAKLVSANPAIANPTVQATATATGGGSSGGLLPTATYRISYTWVDGAGETTAGTSESATLSVTLGQIPRVTIAALPTGAASANIYLTSGAAGTGTLYATGITGTTFDLAYAAATYAGTATPTANTTGAANIISRINAGKAGNLDLLWRRTSDLVSNYVHGDPVDFQKARSSLRHLDYVFAMYKQVTKEILTLIAANPGSLHSTASPTINTTKRTFP